MSVNSHAFLQEAEWSGDVCNLCVALVEVEFFDFFSLLGGCLAGDGEWLELFLDVG